MRVWKRRSDEGVYRASKERGTLAERYTIEPEARLDPEFVAQAHVREVEEHARSAARAELEQKAAEEQARRAADEEARRAAEEDARRRAEEEEEEEACRAGEAGFEVVPPAEPEMEPEPERVSESGANEELPIYRWFDRT